MSKVFLVFALLAMCSYVAASEAGAQTAGDASGDGSVDASDVVCELNYLFRNGPWLGCFDCGDANGDCALNAGDVVYLITYLFRQGPEPQIPECGWSEPVNVGEPINSPTGEESFRMTPDGRMAVWASNRYGTHGNHDIWYSFWDRVSSSWTEPQNCGPNVNTMIQDLGPCLSPDGTKLYYIQFERPGGCGGWDIWVSTWDSLEQEWGVPENLGPTINGSSTEWSPFVSPDGSKLYFSDHWGIWVSQWNGSAWDTPVFLDTTVNGNLGEEHPSVTGDNRTVYITRALSTYCIWVSHWTGTGWGTAELLGPQINDPGGAGQSYVTPDGSKLYFTSARPGGVGSSDIWVSERIPVTKRTVSTQVR